MKAYVGVDVQIRIFLTSEIVGGEWSASRPSPFTPEERARGIHWIGGWVIYTYIYKTDKFNVSHMKG
jgi:hypothetical protein